MITVIDEAPKLRVQFVWPNKTLLAMGRYLFQSYKIANYLLYMSVFSVADVHM